MTSHAEINRTAAEVIETTIYKNVADIPRLDWDAIAEQYSETYRHAFWAHLEESTIGGISDLRYVMVRENGIPAAIATCYAYRLDAIEEIGAATALLVKGIRTVWPSLLLWRAVECGTPLHVLSPPFLIRKSLLPGQSKNQVLSALCEAFASISHELKATFLGLKNVAQVDEIRQLNTTLPANERFKLVDGVATTVIPIRWSTFDDYLGSLRSYYRSKAKKYLRVNEAAGIDCETLHKFDYLANHLARQWRSVFDHSSGNKQASIDARFYEGIGKAMGENAILLLFTQGGKPVAHALTLHDGDTLRWLYTGKQTAEKDSLYMYVMLQVIKLAIRLRVRNLDCGPTTYPIKQDLGASVVPLDYALRFQSLPYRLLPERLIRRLRTIDTPSDRAVFKNED